MTLSSTAYADLRRESVHRLMLDGQDRLVRAFEEVDGTGLFSERQWQRPGGGGGKARVLEGGSVFERAGVNVSAVHGDRVPPSLAARHPAAAGQPFFATGISMVLHPRNPYLPACHANYRYFETGGMSWFGGGADLTPSYLFEEDVNHFHRSLRDQCQRHDVSYEQLKSHCDDYFYIRHRREHRGVGGIFFDELDPPDACAFDHGYAFAADGIATILSAYLPIVERRKDLPFGESQRRWQALRRGRYVEFNLVYDRGTLFGLQTGGDIEAILMSLPPQVTWASDHRPAPDTPEAQMLAALTPRDWVGDGGGTEPAGPTRTLAGDGS